MRLCLFLLFAGILDAILTHFGILSGIIEEANPLMQAVMDKGWTYFYFIKILLPFMLIGLYFLRPLEGRLRTLLISACVIYFSVLVYHMAWILLYFHTST
jgi:Domain of unknown function (DUF5658)